MLGFEIISVCKTQKRKHSSSLFPTHIVSVNDNAKERLRTPKLVSDF